MACADECQRQPGRRFQRHLAIAVFCALSDSEPQLEVRGGPDHFTYSKVMAWVAFDRGIKTAEAFGLEAPVDSWRRIRAEIHQEVCERAFNRELGAFTQSYGSGLLDASTLLIPQVGFLPPDDARVRGTIAAVEHKLLRDGLVIRYNTAATEDGLPPGEGAFLACSFWLADAYVLTGRRANAQHLFERVVGLCNDVGLLAEEYDVSAQRAVGNFPQAFSHIALVNTAHNIAAARKPCDQRSTDTTFPEPAAWGARRCSKPLPGRLDQETERIANDCAPHARVR